MNEAIQITRGAYRADNNYYSMSMINAARSLDKFTFNTKYLDPKYVPGVYETPINEVKFADFRDFIPDKYTGIDTKEYIAADSYTEYLKLLKKTIRNVLLEYIDPREKYIFMHSAGYDSRILSAAMAEIRDVGVRDMSNIHFRCHEPECRGFEKIMQAEHWPKEQYSCWQGPEKDYYDIGKSEPSVNGFVPIVQQMNFWSDIVDDESEWIAIFGLGGEAWKYVGQKIKPQYNFCEHRKLNLLIDHNPNHGEWESAIASKFKDIFLPLFTYEYVKVSCNFDPRWVKKIPRDGGDNIRKDLCSMYNYDITDIPHGEHVYLWRLSDERKKQINDLFYSGRFYKHYGKYLPEIDFSENLFKWQGRLWGFAVTIYDRI